MTRDPSLLTRYFAHPDTGNTYAVHLASREQRLIGGIAPLARTLVFLDTPGGWVGSLPVLGTVRLEDYSVRELAGLVGAAASEAARGT